MKVIEITKEYFKLEDGTVVEHFEKLEVLPTLEEFQEMYNKSQKFVEGR